MPAPYYFFVKPFAVNGDKTAIPTETTGTGAMSYQEGFGIDYQLDLSADPDALPIPRGQTNRYLYDITNNINQYQAHGVPYFITEADNLGVAFPYDIYARVIYDAGSGPQIYENQVQGNTALPTDPTWIVISGSVGLPSGSVIDFAGNTIPAGFLGCDGSTVSRTTYARLMSAITTTLTGTMNTTITVTGLSSTANLFVGMKVEGANIASGTTIATIASGTSITLSIAATGSATNALNFFQWGNGDGTTTFTLPDYRRRTSIGMGGSGSATIGNLVGQNGGQESHVLTIPEMPSHTHALGNGGSITSDQPGAGYTTGSSPAATTGLNSTGGGGAHNNMQPANVVNKIIKT